MPFFNCYAARDDIHLEKGDDANDEDEEESDMEGHGTSKYTAKPESGCIII